MHDVRQATQRREYRMAQTDAETDREGSAPGITPPQLRFNDADLAVWEVFQNPIHFTQFFFPDPSARVRKEHYFWESDKELRVWAWQYPFFVWMTGVFCCGKNIGKSMSIIYRRIWKAIFAGAGRISVIACGKEQYTRRLWLRIMDLFRTHPIFSFWHATDMRRTQEQSSKMMWFKTQNNWRCQGLLSGLRGAGFAGERGHDRIIDEAQALDEEEHGQIRNLLEEPFEPARMMEDLNFGVPDGNLGSPFYAMDTDDSSYGRYSNCRRKIPAYLHPGITQRRFTEMLRENHCQFEIRGDRIVVNEWSAIGKQVLLGQWGELQRTCFPPSLYARNLHDPPLYHYQTWMMGVHDADQSGFPTLSNFCQGWLKRHTVPGLHPSEDPQSQVIVAVDPGKQNCAVTIWGRRMVSGDLRYRWWLLGRVMLRGIPDGPTQARIVSFIADWWEADIIVTDSTSQSSYLSDYLGDPAMFPKHQRYYIRDDQLNWDTIHEAKSRGKQIILGISMLRETPIEFDDLGEMRTANTDVLAVYRLADMMANSELALPGTDLDLEFYAAMTTYAEQPKGSSGRRFTPAHQHWVACVKAFWCAHWLINLLPVPATPSAANLDISLGIFTDMPSSFTCL